MNPNFDIFQLNNKIHANNNYILLGIINNLQQIINYSKDNLIIQILSEVINKINFIINENRKNAEQLKNDINKLINKVNQIDNKIDLIISFGQTPYQLFNGKHPAKEKRKKKNIDTENDEEDEEDFESKFTNIFWEKSIKGNTDTLPIFF